MPRYLIAARMATIGRKTASKDFQAPAGMNGAAPSGVAGARRLCSHTRTAQATTPNVSQKGKNPAPGPALVQRTDSRSASRSRTPAPTTRARAMSVSALRITEPPEGKRRGASRPPGRLWFWRQSSFNHQVLHGLVFLVQPPDELGAGKKRLREGPAVDEIGHFRSLHEFPEDVLIIRDRLCRHVLRTKDPAQHLVFDREPEFLNRGDVLPRTDLDALSGKDRQRPDPLPFPVPHHLQGVVHGELDLFADDRRGHRAPTGEGHVGEVHAPGLLQQHHNDLVLLL